MFKHCGQNQRSSSPWLVTDSLQEGFQALLRAEVIVRTVLVHPPRTVGRPNFMDIPIVFVKMLAHFQGLVVLDLSCDAAEM